MLVDGVHSDQSDLVIVGSGSSSLSTALSLQNGNAGIGNRAAQALALQSSNSSLNTFVAHDIGVLSHGSQDVAVLDQAQDGIGLVETDTDHRRTGSLDSIACTVGGAFVSAENANNALSDVVLSNGLGLGSVAFAVLGLQQFECGTLESGTEAGLTGNAGSGSSVNIDDTDLAFGDALSSQLSQHGFASSLTSSFVVGGEGCLSSNVCGRVDVDDLNACGNSLIQSGRDSIGAVGSHDDGLVTGGDCIVDLFDLQCVVLGIGSHEGQLNAQFGSSLLSAFLQGDPVLVDGVHGDQCDLVGIGAFCSGSLLSAAACQQSHDHSQAQQDG